MTEKEMIADMQKVMEYTCNVYDEKGNHIRNKCNAWDCEYYCDTNGVCCSYSKKEATALYNAGYRNCKDKVVLSKEEYEGKEIAVEMSGGHKLRLTVGKFGEMSRVLEESTRKETAKEIFEKVLSYIGSNQKFCIVDNDNQTLIDCDKLWEFVGILAKQLGVEVEE